eukprot:CAMPEP_0203648182 /NCGR_PEP_ID=MMETSP0088-20131115/18021_1 /ASSEMBLY_ACC=CAM_ASM_001087 /TAXON_ID=426623 /ORGANISM="Chaetoceros affinis, Strain CCMP159" /LENGTH=241 /DNA_ID=CAMNT_0050506105 /DNA_START=47 /DNA_END=772 /DNA_ORIENTATION=+
MADVCTVCSDPSHIMNDPTARIVWPPGNSEAVGYSCTEIGELLTNGTFTNCTNVQTTLSDDICMCGPDDPSSFTCPLCGDGVNLPEPNRVVAGKTCQGWQYFASYHTSTMDCPYYQKSIAAYCGCDISDPDFFNGYCRLCGDKLLPNFNQKVNFVGGTSEYCAKIEVDVNVFAGVGNIDSKCDVEQEKYKKACKCDTIGVELPTLSPTSSAPDDDSSGSKVTSSTFIRMFCVLCSVSVALL